MPHIILHILALAELAPAMRRQAGGQLQCGRQALGDVCALGGAPDVGHLALTLRLHALALLLLQRCEWVLANLQ